MWYTKDYKLVKKSDPGRRRSLAPAFVLFYRRCLTTNSIANRMPRLLAMLFVLLGLFCAAALPAHAEDYDTVLDRLSRLQALAREYSANQADTPDPIELTLAYTRTGEYNTTIWQLTAGVRDAGFESCVNSSDPELASLQNMNTVVLPNGESIDFGHLLASMNLVYNGIPITGSWGGDCEELARQYYGQAGDAAGYAEAMRASFNMDDDGTLSRFSNGDLRADLDSVVVGSKVTKDTDLAEALRSYYAALCRVKNKTPALRDGDVRVRQAGGGKLCFVRRIDACDAEVYVNQSQENWQLPENGELRFGGGIAWTDTAGITLRPGGFALLLRRKD